MRVLLVAMMLALAGVGFVALAAEPAVAIPPCDFKFPGNQCCWYINDEGMIWWEHC